MCIKSFVVGTHYNHVDETILISTHNTELEREIIDLEGYHWV